MSVTVEAFRAAFPEFADVPDAAVAGALETASLLWSPGRLGKFWERIVMLSVAHRLAVRFNIGRALNAAGMKGADAGVVNSQSASTSSLSVTNANNGMVTGTDPFLADYARTSYGLELLSLLELIMPHGYVVK